jgi:hypothetical protein
MILAKHLLTKDVYQKAIDSGVRKFLYNEINFSPEPKEGIILVNCTTERVHSTWYTWQKNEEVFERFQIKYPQFFVWGNYDLTLAFIKGLFWSNQKTGFLQYVKDKDFSDQKVWQEETLHESKYSHVFLRYHFLLLNSRRQSKAFNQIEKNEKTGFLLKNEFEVTLYKYLIDQSIGNEKVLYFVLNNTVKDALIKMGATQNQLVNCHNFSFRKIPFINYLNLNKTDRFVLNQIVNNWHEVEHWIGVAELIVSSGVSKVLINEAENGLTGATLGEVFNKHGVVSYNTMNGMKAGQAQDSFINFDYWFVWDEKIKQLLMQKNSLSERRLIVSGHLMEDEARDHQFHNSLPISNEDINGKKVISLFSVRGRREEKLEAFDFIYKFAELHKDIILLIRSHPSENAADTIPPPEELNNVYIIDYTDENSKITLYDQLTVSHLSICFGSTVALESKWFGVPCITFEKRDKSLIYLTDNEIIFHVKTKDEFVQKINDLLSIGKKDKFKLMKVADCILETLLK